jgi:putative membrane protein
VAQYCGDKMQIKGKDFFSSKEKEIIRKAVEDAESMTSGEIAVVLVDESDPYREGALIGAFSFSSIASLILSIVFGHETIWFFVPLTVLLVFPGLYLFQLAPHMKLAFVSSKRVVQAVKERAVYAFFQKGIYKTRERTGVLIFISLLERRVWIIGDENIHRKSQIDFWRSLVKELTAGIKNNRTLESLCSVIEKCGAELERHFPQKAHKDNQLGDDISFE